MEFKEALAKNARDAYNSATDLGMFCYRKWAAKMKKVRTKSVLNLNNMEETQYVFCLFNSSVQRLFSSRKFTQICDYTEQKFRLHQYWISSDDDTFVSATPDWNRRVRFRRINHSPKSNIKKGTPSTSSYSLSHSYIHSTNVYTVCYVCQAYFLLTNY